MIEDPTEKWKKASDAARFTDDFGDVQNCEPSKDSIFKDQNKLENIRGTMSGILPNGMKDITEAGHKSDSFDHQEPAEKDLGASNTYDRNVDVKDAELDVQIDSPQLMERQMEESTQHNDKSSQSGALKRCARRQVRRHIALVIQRFDVTDRKSSARGQGVKSGSVEHDPSNQPAKTENQWAAPAPLPKDTIRQRGTDLKALEVDTLRCRPVR